ncbi:tRNA (N(6)-L-threonylcarbamoyladenosine(37)-C(2))-methylthiotransferase MtaB [Methylobacterium sp. WL30]|uniref:tRNA (N(6)-L-threonylcarbamoyladenosine(37)-C(2))- methylthiotransferase MtaB n=1 Tax=unclassified Methylobacterium TaxID=2615210 RepID=UPI0011CB1FA5|nr:MULTISPECIES: tRNA (N(6)-L-threonylcarbamoyladenosine(37)-C(2))-methylthiotransferase MtaB [unclassified Methylobacterium]MCJ2039683.1 tRNA (N(6)-L-threonylcarbamoyladenosine(37)-C(2))-methylthiotransferase MtaB [Methylobacterium sp. J-059]MCJ2113876.1 tRNA (N(6)-L-threonylcarbamoyladenosine(37)-C(2))-methylthiotransferase MtaB [Methylobacterium sp. E-025]TXN22386.1 tRNA (N(6)-L-threonylcarbamoyladenosine(37)-C(2))-methylthiotransferase MtaB [Methylobacterium sp. WL93]TXN69831.1 tRNA (N(6)-L
MAVETLTFGCRLNTVEAEVMRGHAEAASRDRDLVVVNTCAVTTEAGRQARKAIRRLHRERPGAEIVVTGCGAQIETAAYAAMPEVARLVGNGDKLSPAAWGPDPDRPRDAVGDVFAARHAAPTRIAGVAGHTRAFVPVQNGCDHRCTFCVIPFGRGHSRSVAPAAVIDQVARIVAHGGREVVLTGVDLTAYGRDLAGASESLGTLVLAILAAVPDLARLRLSSIDSIEADDALMRALADEPRLMPHLHLSLQAGDDLVLKRMKRRHARSDAIRFCREVRRLRPDAVFGADLIAGFPTETEDQFARSLDLVAECGLTHLHVFPYSPRPGTPAARMPPVAPEIVRGRAARLRAAGAAALVRHLDGEVGRSHRVLAERGGIGRTEGFTPVRLTAEPGTIRTVAILGHDGRALLAA